MADKDKAPAADDNKIDHYVKLSVIATGKHAQILEVQEENTNNRFAMKLLLPEAMKDSEQVSTLKYEGKVAQSLDHPNVIKWIATVHRKTNIYLIMELFRSMSVKNFILVDHLGVQTRIRKLIESTCAALQHMHERGWLHMDVKPDNILLSRSSEVKLIDFSLSQKAKGLLGKMLGGSKEIGGTLTYIAPESIRKEAPTPQTDIYSLGITIFECLTGTFPFKGSTPKDLLMKHLSAVPAPPSDFNKNVTPEMDRMVLRMIAKKPKDRQKNLQEVLSEFRNIQPFKEDPEKLAEQRAAAEKAASTEQTLGKRLDSRTDHARVERAKVDPEYAKELAAKELAKKKKEEAERAAQVMMPSASKEKAKAEAKKAAAAPPKVAPIPMPPMMVPGFAPQMMPGQFVPMPGMPAMMPGQFAPMPGYPAAPGYPPGMPMPGMMPTAQPMPMTPVPGMMPGGAVPAPPPQMPVAPAAASGAGSAAPAVAPQRTAVPATPPAPATPLPKILQRPAPPPVPQNVKPEDLPMMDELPDVL